MYVYAHNFFCFVCISLCTRSVCVPDAASDCKGQYMYVYVHNFFCFVCMYFSLCSVCLRSWFLRAVAKDSTDIHVYVHSFFFFFFFFFFFCVCIYFFLCLVCPIIIKTVVVAVPSGRNRKFLESSVTVFGAVVY